MISREMYVSANTSQTNELTRSDEQPCGYELIESVVDQTLVLLIKINKLSFFNGSVITRRELEEIKSKLITPQ